MAACIKLSPPNLHHYVCMLSYSIYITNILYLYKIVSFKIICLWSFNLYPSYILTIYTHKEIIFMLTKFVVL